MTEPLTAALALAGRGLAVLPVRGKFPTNYHGSADATADPDRLPGLFAERTAATDYREPDGLATAGGRPLPGGGFLVVVDVDPRHGGDASLVELEARYQRLPPTYSYRTPSGGAHYRLRTPEPQATRTGFRLGLDLRGVGGYAVCPPSPGYVLTARHPTAACPEWLLAVLNPPAPILPPRRPMELTDRYVAKAVELECTALASTPEGGRNHRLNLAAFSLARFAVDGQADAGALVQLLAFAAARAGLAEQEITRTIGSAFRARGVRL